jgi:DNA-directed RNA polymerase specialized sigma24 family protein
MDTFSSSDYADARRFAYHYAARRALPRADWDDVAQEAALAIWRSKATLPGHRAIISRCAVAQWMTSARAHAVAGATNAHRRRAGLSRFAAQRGLDPTAPETMRRYDAHINRVRKDPIKQGALTRGDATRPSTYPTDQFPGTADATSDDFVDTICENTGLREELLSAFHKLDAEAQKLMFVLFEQLLLGEDDLLHDDFTINAAALSRAAGVPRSVTLKVLPGALAQLRKLLAARGGVPCGD